MFKKISSQGFTLIELLIVMALIVIIAVAGIPLYRPYLHQQRLQANAHELQQVIREAQQETLSGKKSDTHGVYFGTNSYTLFKGASYATRVVSEDRVTNLNSPVTISSTSLTGSASEVVFGAVNGKPIQTGTVTLQAETYTLTITINEWGLATLN